MGFAGGGVFDEREEVKTREDRVGEEMGGELDVLGRDRLRTIYLIVSYQISVTRN